MRLLGQVQCLFKKMAFFTKIDLFSRQFFGAVIHNYQGGGQSDQKSVTHEKIAQAI